MTISEPTIPEEYTDLVYVFLKQKADELPDYTSNNYAINTAGKQPLFGPLYNLS